MDFEHFMEIFRALLSNQEPILSPPDERDEAKDDDFCRLLISIIVVELCMTIIEFLWLLAIGPLRPSPWWLLDEELLPQPLLLTIISGPIRCVWLRLCIFPESWCEYELDKTSTPCVPRLFVDLLLVELRPFCCWCCFKLCSYMIDNEGLGLDSAKLFVDEEFVVTIEDKDEFGKWSGCWSMDEKLLLISKLLLELSFMSLYLMELVFFSFKLDCVLLVLLIIYYHRFWFRWLLIYLWCQKQNYLT